LHCYLTLHWRMSLLAGTVVGVDVMAVL
jgi:hypothetical protein